MMRLVCIILVFGIGACTQDKALNQKVEVLLKQKLETFEAEQLKACQDVVLSDARRIADSLLVELSKNSKWDSILQIIDTTKPLPYDLLFPEYQAPVRPEIDTLYLPK